MLKCDKETIQCAIVIAKVTTTVMVGREDGQAAAGGVLPQITGAIIIILLVG